MDRSLRNLLGMLEDNKREYRFVDGEVSKEEYQYCQILDQILFGDKGYVATLGPTWYLVNDPRFIKIESAFIISRRAIFGGNAMLGKQYISSDGTFTSTIGDLEEYSEILGEGRHFHNVLVHPNENCPTRKWLERIHTITHYKAGELSCECTPVLDPHDLKNQSDAYLWSLIRRECPNYFTKADVPNKESTRLFDLFHEDLVGLVADYAVTPLIDEWVLLETGDVAERTEKVLEDTVLEEQPRVFAEVDILEKALTSRALLRATAAKILRQIGFQNTLKEMGEVRLTDLERDQLIRLVFNPNPMLKNVVSMDTNYYGYLSLVRDAVQQFLLDIRATGKKYDERQAEQLATASQKSKTMVSALINGELQPINQYTEPVVEVEQDDFAKTMEAILSDPRKQELFLIFTEAERLSENGKTDEEKLRMRKLSSVLYPVFMDADYELTDERMAELYWHIDELFDTEADVTEIEEEFHG